VTYCFYTGLCLGIIIFQTAAAARIPLFSGFYDLLIPFVLYLGIFRPARESLPVLCILGGVMDNLSGGPFGLYLMTYFWIYIVAKWGVSFLHVGNYILYPFVAVLGVLAENLLFFAAFAVSGISLPADAFKIVGTQVLWAFSTGAFVILLLIYTHKKWDRWITRYLAKENSE
jgi:hypothetical protein